MNHVYNFVAIFAISFGLSLLLTRALIAILPKFGMVDAPSNRRAHSKITPRGGGIAFALVFASLLPLAENYFFAKVEYSRMMLQVFVPITLVSFWDDISHVFIPIRFAVQALCAVLAVMWLIHPHTVIHEMPIYVDLAISSFALLAFLNVYNFLDGIDGITFSQTAHLSTNIILLCLIEYSIVPYADMLIIMNTIILGWALGFGYFNWQPAKIFLGDAGSIGIGFVLGICILTVASGSLKLFAACLISALYYVADGSITILIRIVKGEKFWEPHLQHFFQKAVRKGYSHKKVVKRIILCNFLLMLCSVASLFYPLVSIVFAAIIVMVTLIRSTL